MKNNLFDLSGKAIFVTGASSGIGRAIALACSQQAAQIFLTARNPEKLEETLKMLEPGGHSFFPADLTNDADVDAMVSDLPELDGVVLNAGRIKILPVQFIKKDALENLFSINLHSSIILIQKLLKSKKIKKGCSICFISSIASLHVTPGNAMYSATKGAVNSYARALALELAPKHIRVNAVLPGFVETGLIEDSPVDSEQLKIHRKNYPLGRFGKPQDVAHLCVYLLSDASEWMTGSLITIDGGYSIK